MKNIKIIALFFLIITIQGCVTTYKYQNKDYKDRASAENAIRSFHNNLLSNVQALPAPITDKKLIFGIPNSDMIKSKGVKFSGDRSTDTARDRIGYVAYSLEVDFNNLAKMIRKRNIYKNVEIIRTDGGHLQPSNSTDVYYIYLESLTVAQTYIADKKYGKQVMTMDKGISDTNLKIKNWLDTIAAFAIRE